MTTTKKPTPPKMTPYADRRPRKHLTRDEVMMMEVAARAAGRHGHRDATMIWFMFRHGLRSREVRSLTWSQVNLKTLTLYMQRCKNGTNAPQRLAPHEVGALLTLRREGMTGTEFVFVTERGTPLGPSALYKIVRRAGDGAKIGFPVNPHMLRHSTGYHLTNVRDVQARRVQDYLGHRDINHTVAYSALDDHKFDGLWEDENA